MSRLILAVDTTSEDGSVALLHDSEVVEEVALHAPKGFSQVLYGHLAELLERHGLKAGDIECFAAASGPGSFTGVRVGLTCAKGLAEATRRPAVAVSNLQALSAFGTGRLRAVVLDARRGEVYGAVYDDAARVVSPEVVAPLESWLESLPDGELEFLSPMALALPDCREVRKTPRSLAGAVGRMAAGMEWRDPAALDANYVRRADAELFWRE